MNLSDLRDQVYLGDGVYAGHDGYHVVLWLYGESAFSESAIALEPTVLEGLVRYHGRVASKYAPGAEVAP